MKKLLPLLLLCCTPLFAETPRGEPVESVPPAQQILAFARAQLPSQPIRMNGTLKEWAKNEFLKKKLTIEMDLNWGADPANATYRIRDEKSGLFQCLEIQWAQGGPVFQYSENGQDVADFNPDKEIDGLGVTWADLSFSFLWTGDAETVDADQKPGKDCHVISIPRGENHLLLWIEKQTGRTLGAKEETAASKNSTSSGWSRISTSSALWKMDAPPCALIASKRRKRPAGHPC